MPRYEVELSTSYGSVRTSCVLSQLDLDQIEEALRQKIRSFPSDQREALLASLDPDSIRVWCDGRLVWPEELKALPFDELKALRQALQQQLEAVVEALTARVESRLAELDAAEAEAKADLERALALQAEAEARLQAIAEERAKLLF